MTSHWWPVCLFFFLMTIAMDSGILVNSTNQCSNVKTPLDSLRKRRHLTFPDKSDFVMTISLVKAFMTHAPSGWNLALEIDVLYPLPDAKFTNALYRRKLHHRQKRRFWEALEGAINLHNINGRSCLIRSICEAKTKVAPAGSSLVHDLLRAIFTAPLHEKGFRDEVKESFSELLEPGLCDKPNDCPFSLLYFIMSLNKAY